LVLSRQLICEDDEELVILWDIQNSVIIQKQQSSLLNAVRTKYAELFHREERNSQPLR